MPAHWTRGRRRSVVLTVLAALAVVTAATTAGFVFLGGGGPPKHPRALSTTLASQQLAGLVDPGPGAGSGQRLLAPSGGGLAFLAGRGDGNVLASEQWQADQMTDGSYVLVYVPDGRCLNAGTSRAAAPAGQLTLTACDLHLSQRWSHPYLGKDSAGRDYWQLRSASTGQCLTASGADWRDGTPAQLQPCGSSLRWQQLVEFWSAY